MSPFSQLGNAVEGLSGSSNSIDRNLSSALRYLDEFDRHFSHHHRFMNCFIPRFDLEEDSQFYYLYGELPGAKVEDITIEAHGENTLVVHGRTNRPYSLDHNTSQRESPRSDGSDPFVKVPLHNGDSQGVLRSEDGNTCINVDTSDAGKPTGQHGAAAPKGTYPDIDRRNPDPPAPRPANVVDVDVSDAEKPRHHSHPNRLIEHDSSNESLTDLNQHRTLLSERLVGDFHRTFTFPCPISEEGVRASMENGVLHLLVPKITGRTRGRRIQISHNR